MDVLSPSISPATNPWCHSYLALPVMKYNDLSGRYTLHIRRYAGRLACFPWPNEMCPALHTVMPTMNSPRVFPSSCNASVSFLTYERTNADVNPLYFKNLAFVPRLKLIFIFSLINRKAHACNSSGYRRPWLVVGEFRLSNQM